MSDSIACWIVQVRSVVAVSMPRSRPTSQKPESLTCEANTDPAAVARVIAMTWSSLKSPAMTPEAMRLAVVVSATVAEPWARRSATAMM